MLRLHSASYTYLYQLPNYFLVLPPDVLVNYGPGVLYSLAEVHKKLIDGFPTFQPILATIETPTDKIAKFFVPILKDLTSNKYSVKDLYDFAKEILQQNPDCFMASLDTTSLFTKIPLGKTTKNCLNESFNKKQCVSNLDQDSFEKLLGLLRKSHFSFSINFLSIVRWCSHGFSIGSHFG